MLRLRTMSSYDIWVKDIVSREFIDTYTPLHQEGPDYIIPCEEMRTWEGNGATKLDVVTDTTEDFWRPISVVTCMEKTVEKFQNNVALAVKRDNEWIKWTYNDYWNDVKIVAKGFIKLGLEQFHGVGILGFNAPEWVISHLAAIFAGGFSAGIYPTNNPESCSHILQDSSANIVVVENELQLEKILKMKENLPNLKAIVQYIGKPKHPDVLSWSDLIEIGKSLPDEILDRRIKGLSINQCSCLIYTSGTTGPSKGVMLNHDNIVYLVKCFIQNGWEIENSGQEVIMSYLPLSHIAATALDIYAAIISASSVYFAPPEVLKTQFVQTLQEIQPTFLIVVPRILEKVQEKVQKVEESMFIFKRMYFNWTRKHALNYHLNKLSTKPIGYKLSQHVFKKTRKALGLEQTRAVYCGGGPLPQTVHEYLFSLDIVVAEGYGLSESSGFHIYSCQDDVHVGSVGNINNVPEMEVKIKDPDKDGNGQILLRGRNIFMGYLKLQEETEKAIDNDRWLDSGDLGKIDESGYLYVTGRSKELIITSGGENVAPLPIEETIKKLLPVVSNCMLIGERRKYLTMLITFKVETDPSTGEFLDQLQSPALQWCKNVGSDSETLSQIIGCNESKVMKAVQAGIDQYNKNSAVSSAQRIQKWRILKDDFSELGGEFGNTGKMKRSFIVTKYAEEIESMYDEK